MALFPWSAAEPQDQLFCLITGANSGAGLGIGQRLIDQFLLSRSPSSHLILITTTRSVRKSVETIHALRKHLEHTLVSPKFQKSGHATSNGDANVSSPSVYQAIANRIHILSIQLSLTDLANIYSVASQLVHGTVSNPPPAAIPASRLSYPDYKDVNIPRLDALALNAGVGGWTHLDWLGFAKKALLKGWVEAVTFADFKIAAIGKTVSVPLPAQNILTDGKTDATATTTEGADAPNGPVLGEVFAANVFGHYVFVHQVLPLITRSPEEVALGVPIARIVWQSSIEPHSYHLRLDDIQGLRTSSPYESSKRLTDVLALSSHLPSVRNKAAASYFSSHNADEDKTTACVPPKIYVTHPGIVVTTIFPLPKILMLFYWLGMLLARWLGSPWHTSESYPAAVAPVWLMLETDDGLTAQDAERSKWGSARDRHGREACKRTEVELWGWEGKVEDLTAAGREEEKGILSKQVGRWSEAKATTKDDLEEFEILGHRCWDEMEKLRLEWDARMKGERSKE